jgi:CspA family cold shock protein
MANGTIKRLTEKGFGFIESESGKDMFFHKTNVEGASYEALQVGQPVSFTEAQGAKGPKAENVRPV